MQYEINYLVLQSKTANLDQIREDIKNLLTSHGAEITAEKRYLKRKLAYEIKNEGYGFYTVLRFNTDEGEKLFEIKKDLNLNNNVSRYIVVKAEELPSLEAATETEKAAQSTIKPEDVEKIIATSKKEETKAKTVVEEKAATEKIEKEPETVETAKEEENIEAGEKEEPKEEKPAKKKRATKEKKEEKNQEDKASLDELDKKLDEILNI